MRSMPINQYFSENFVDIVAKADRPVLVNGFRG